MEEQLQILRPSIFDGLAGLVAGQSTRRGGVSASTYDSLNLGSSTDDDLSNVTENKKRFCESLGFTVEQVVRSHQIHSDQILIASQGGSYEGYDALVTQEPNLLLVVSTADCVPILLYDPINEVCAAIHAGWKGTVLKIVSKTVAMMEQHFGSIPANMKAYIGACIDHCHFEVGPEVLEKFETKYISKIDEKSGKGYVDLKASNQAQLLAAGLTSSNIETSPYCTFDDAHRFFSHRRDRGKTGRMWSVIGIIK